MRKNKNPRTSAELIPGQWSRIGTWMPPWRWGHYTGMIDGMQQCLALSPCSGLLPTASSLTREEVIFMCRVTEISIMLSVTEPGLFPATQTAGTILGDFGTIVSLHAGHYGGGVGHARYMVRDMTDHAGAIAALP